MNTETLTLILSDELLARIRSAAEDAGLTPEVWAAERIEASLQGHGVREDATTFDTASRSAFRHAAAAAALDEYDRTGVSYPLEDVLSEVRADLEARLAAKV